MKKLISLLTVVFLTTGLNAEASMKVNEQVSAQINEKVKVKLEEEIKESGIELMEKLQEEISKISEQKMEDRYKKLYCEEKSEDEYMNTKA